MTNRRDFLKGAGVLTLGAMMPEIAVAKSKKTAKKGKKYIGLQTYSLGPELSGSNVAEGLKRLQKMGYTHLELAGYGKGKIGGISMADYKKMADDAGLIITSSHLNPDTIARSEKYSKANFTKLTDFWKRATEDHAILGVPFMVQPGLPAIDSIEDAQAVCEGFNAAGDITKQAGIQFGYHNHNREFCRVVAGGKGKNPDFTAREGRQIEEIFINGTDPAKVIFELDVYWTVMGCQDPVEWIDKYAERIKMLHIKDRMVLGQSGMMNFEQIFKHFYSHGEDHKNFYVEVEDVRSGKQFQRVEDSINYLLAADFVK